MSKRYVILPICHDHKSAVIDDTEWPIGNPELLRKHPPVLAGDHTVGLFSCVPDDQFVYYIPTTTIREIKTCPTPAAVQKPQPETGIVTGYEEAGYKPWENPIDLECAKQSKCECCGHKGLGFKGFTKKGFQTVRIAVAICPKCKHEFEF